MIPRTLILLGLALIVIGLVALVMQRLNLPLGRLPGDLSWRGRNWRVAFPLGSSLLLSLILSLLLYVAGRVRR